LLCCVTSSAKAASFQEQVASIEEPERVATDARLSAKVNISEYAVPLADLLRTLSRATGAKIELNPRIQDQKLSISVRMRAVRDVMRAIRLLFGYRWLYRPSSDTYVLSPGKYDLLKADMQAADEHDLRQRIGAVRAALANRTNLSAVQYVGFRILASLTDAQVATLVHSGALPLSVEQLTARERRYLASSTFGELGPAGTADAPPREIDDVRLVVDNSLAGGSRVVLSWRAGYTTGSREVVPPAWWQENGPRGRWRRVSPRSAVGETVEGEEDRLHQGDAGFTRRWVPAFGDEYEAGITARGLVSPQPIVTPMPWANLPALQVPARVPTYPRGWARRGMSAVDAVLASLASATRLEFVADCHLAVTDELWGLSGTTLAAILDQLCRQAGLMAQYQSGVFVFRRLRWYALDACEPPLRLLSPYLEDVREHGRLTATELASLVAQSTSEERARLVAAAPELAGIEPVAPAFRLLPSLTSAQANANASPTGLGPEELTDAQRSTLSSSGPLWRLWLSNAQNRLRVTDQGDGPHVHVRMGGEWRCLFAPAPT